MASATLNRLSSAKMDDIFTQGLHEFIGRFVVENNALGAGIAEQYLS